MSSFRIALLMGMLVCVGVSFGCVSSAPTSYYILQSGQAPFQAESLPKKGMRLAEITLPTYLDRRDIIARDTVNPKLEVATLHQWAEPLDKGMRRVLQEVLTPALAKQGYSLLQEGESGANSPSLCIDVMRFDGNFGAKSTLEARWQLRAVTGDIVAQGSYADEQPCGTTYTALAKSQSQLVQRFGAFLAQALLQRLP